MQGERLRLCPVFARDAKRFVNFLHRHHEAPVGDLFRVGVMSVREGETDAPLVGVAMIGRPVSRHMQDGWTCEVIRLCVEEGHRNARSLLYGAAWRAARALGYKRIITYTLPEEGGASLRAAGWICDGDAGGGSWSREERPREDKAPTSRKVRWRKEVDENRELRVVQPDFEGDDAPATLDLF